MTFGAAWPSPHIDVSRIAADKSASRPTSQLGLSIKLDASTVPSRHDAHCPQDSFLKKRIMLRAIKTYCDFSELGMLFDNQRLLAEGMPLPPPFSSYAGLCETTSQGHSIAEQMRFDYK